MFVMPQQLCHGLSNNSLKTALKLQNVGQGGCVVPFTTELRIELNPETARTKMKAMAVPPDAA